MAGQAQNQYNFAQFGGRLRLFHLGGMMGYHTWLHSCRTCFVVSMDLLNPAVAACLSMGLQIIFDFSFNLIL